MDLQSAQIGYATSDQLMAIEARDARAGLQMAGDEPVARVASCAGPRSSIRCPRAPTQSAALTGPEVTASEAASFQQAFIGAALSDTASFPPDPSGAAGPTQFILAANGRIRSFSKATGTADLVLNFSTNAFFAAGPERRAILRARRSNTTVSPAAGSSLRRLDAVPGRIVIASSNASTITATTLWSFFSFDNNGFPGAPTCAVDSPTFGLDPYALYIGVLQFCDPGGVYMGTSGFVVRKTSVIDFATIAVTAFHNLTGSSTAAGPFAPQGVDIDDPNARDRVLYRRRQRVARAR